MNCEKAKKMLEDGHNPAENEHLYEHIKNCAECRAEIESYYPEFARLFREGKAIDDLLFEARAQLMADIPMPDDSMWRSEQKRLFDNIEKKRSWLFRPAFAGILAAMLALLFIIVSPNDLLKDNTEIPMELVSEYFMGEDGYTNSMDDLTEIVSIIGTENLTSLLGIDEASEAADEFAEELGTENVIASFDEDTQEEFLAYMQAEMHYPNGPL